MKFSIIIPTYNAQEYIAECINNILMQIKPNYELEILLIDDCSSDYTFKKIEELSLIYKEIQLFKTQSNRGPGIARNIGINNATGDWIMFVDCDDKLHKNALEILSIYIEESKVDYDLIAYNFEYDVNSTVMSHNTSRNDFPSLYKNKNNLILDYLSLHMDGSIIYTLLSRSFVKNHSLMFAEGLHEDVDFLFKAYLNCKHIGKVDKPLYIKLNHKNSIINNSSHQHFKGFFRAYKEMYKYLEHFSINSEIRISAYYTGIIGVCATKVRSLSEQKKTLDLYKSLYVEVESALSIIPQRVNLPTLTTKYFMIYMFLKKNINSLNLVEDITRFLEEISKKSWSCYDLHHSLFLAPEEIRTCCKRFFVNNEMKGDVTLLGPEDDFKNRLSIQNILEAKKELYFNINKNTSDECGGCPFLEFKEWPSLKSLDVQYLSFEYHSVCNMKCTYCSDVYYGGKKSTYDVDKFTNKLIASEALGKNATIVYGGGEPTIGDDFSSLLLKIEKSSSNIKQRVITNATKYNEALQRLINEDKASIITSIDAGTKEVFYEVRKHKGLDNVLNNLVKYATKKPENVTIKYILLDQNKDLHNIKEFAKLIKEKKLHQCNFQISFDFKRESINFDFLTSIVLLYGELKKLNVRLVFVDDLLRVRLPYKLESYRQLKEKLVTLGYQDILADYSKYSNVVIWGAGNQTKHLLENSIFLKNTHIKYLVDNTTSKIGKKLLGYNIKDPSCLLENNYPIIISATQATPQIMNEFNLLKINQDRIIKSFIF